MKTDLDRRIEAAKKWIYKRSIDLPNAFRDSDEVLHELLDNATGTYPQPTTGDVAGLVARVRSALSERKKP